MTATCIYSSVSCNVSAHCMDWGSNGLICFGACNSVTVYDPAISNNSGKVLHTLVSHKGVVNSVRWLVTKFGNEIVSGSVDKRITIWVEDSVNQTYTVKEIISGHDGSVKLVKPLYLPDEDFTWIASASSDSTIRLWKRNSTKESFNCTQTISFGNGFALDLVLSRLTHSPGLLLVVGQDDSKVCLYTADKDEIFKVKLSLTGHEDWVTGIDITSDVNGEFLIASCSQDSFIRLWRIVPVQNEIGKPVSHEITLKDNKFSICDNVLQDYSVTLESILAGHENWVMSIQWEKTCKQGKLPRLLSSSTDKTLIIWEHINESGLWLEKVRVGEVGGNTLGFYNAVFSPDGLSVLANGNQGAFHRWNQTKEGNWESAVALHGHSQEVADICWFSPGAILLSCSLDQTTRLHAPWQQVDFQVDKSQMSWHEVARPQVHGYDLWALTSISSIFFASAGEEKIIRVFASTKNFVENFSNISQMNGSKLIGKMQPNLPEGASVPSLGLSNKAVFQSDLDALVCEDDVERHPKDQYPEHYFKSFSLKEPPSEDILLQNTLWPEIQKLYGHGYEVFSLAANHAGTILASSCKASKSEHAGVILWDVSNWKQIGHLLHHSLTVTQMAFSPDDNFLLSVSRDRTWSLYQLKNGFSYEQVACTEKGRSFHSRIIWACSWSHNSKFFATASRDKKVIVWSVSENGKVAAASIVLETDDSATAIDFGPQLTSTGRYLLGIGLENGHIFLYSWAPLDEGQSSDWKLIVHLNQTQAHHLCVKRLRFSPSNSSPERILLASCSSDHFVRIFLVDAC